MFESFTSRFPSPLNADFFVSEPIGKCFIAFSSYERDWLNEPKQSSLAPHPMIIFFDADERDIATIYLYCCDGSGEFNVFEPQINDEKWLIDNDLYDHFISKEQFMSYMIQFYPDIAAYLLWLL